MLPPSSENLEGSAEASEVSQDGDQHSGTKFPRRLCLNHPGCPLRYTCPCTHGLVRSLGAPNRAVLTCFLGQAPHNQSCHEPTWNGGHMSSAPVFAASKRRKLQKDPWDAAEKNALALVQWVAFLGSSVAMLVLRGVHARSPHTHCHRSILLLSQLHSQANMRHVLGLIVHVQ
jgi:hypothetical protein